MNNEVNIPAIPVKGLEPPPMREMLSSALTLIRWGIPFVCLVSSSRSKPWGCPRGELEIGDVPGHHPLDLAEGGAGGEF